VSGRAPLIGRDKQDILFRRRSGPVTAAAFLGAARRLAEALSPAEHVVNLCQERYAFAVAFAAAVLRGQVSLLTSDPSEAGLAALRTRFAGLTAITDADIPEPLADASSAPVPMIPDTLLAALVFTSGTTGTPIAHPKRFGALVRRSHAIADRFGFTGAPTSLIATVPPQHMYGFETTILLPFHAAVAVSCLPAFYPADVAQALAEAQGRRAVITTPLQLRAMLDIRPPALDRVISATAPLDPDLAARIEAAWHTELHEIYGATEAGSVASRRTTATPTWTPFDDLRLVPSGDDIMVEAKDALPTPLNDEIALQPDGFTLLGRKTDMVKMGGKRASLAGLNRILLAIEGVEDGVILAPDDLDRRPGARLLAYVVAPDTTADDILAALRRQVDPVFLPRRIVTLSALPRNAVGKLTKTALEAFQEERLGPALNPAKGTDP